MNDAAEPVEQSDQTTEHDVPTPEPPVESVGSTPRKFGWQLPVLAIAAVAVIGSLVVAYQATRDAEKATPNEPGASATTAVTVPAGFTTYTDPETAFSISHPTQWERLKPPESDVRLLLGAGGQNSLLVRVIRLEQPVTAANIGDVKAFTDSIVSGAGVTILQERSITLGGLPGYYYLYTFTDTASGQKGLHAHYFLFAGRKMNTLVFQALPADDFSGLAATFDQVAESFRSTLDLAPAAPTTSTTT